MTTRNFRVKNGISIGDVTIDATTNKITGLSTSAPSAAGDVATKQYVDDSVSTGGTQIISGNTSVTATDNDDSTSVITLTVDGATIATVVGDGITLAAGKELNGTATAAQYADVAERFHADANLEPGTVVALGGVNEITAVAEEASDEVFGVITSIQQAAFKMNGGAGPDETHPYVAMTGRVNVKVKGAVNKGDRLIASSIPGVAKAASKAECTAFNVIGRALESKDTTGLGSVLAAVRTSH